VNQNLCRAPGHFPHFLFRRRQCNERRRFGAELRQFVEQLERLEELVKKLKLWKKGEYGKSGSG
jgi:hypothetical protein